MKLPVVKKCWLEDIADLCLLTKEFIEESEWKFTYSEEIAVSQLFAYITQEDRSAVFGVYVDGEIAGGSILVATQDLSAEKIGFIHKFYIRPQYRKTLAAISLAKSSAEWMDEMGCEVSFVTSTGHVGEGAICAFTKLMGKCDYESSGPTLYRLKREN